MVARILAQAGPSCASFKRHASPGNHNILNNCLPGANIQHANLCRKSFSTSSRIFQGASTDTDNSTGREGIKGYTHYHALGVPPGASRMEIKSAYFRLSKRYHPDVRRSARSSGGFGNAEGGTIVGVGVQKQNEAEEKRSTERFHEVSAAYRVLSDDRQRRAYDRSLTLTSFPQSHRTRTPHHAHAHTPGSSHSHAYVYELHSRRRRGATHAWENTGPRAHAGRTYAHAHNSSTAGRHYDPSTSPFAQYQYQTSSNGPTGTSSSLGSESGLGTGTVGQKTSERLTGRALRDEEERIAHDRIVRESNISRFFRALGIILVVSWVGSLGSSLGS